MPTLKKSGYLNIAVAGGVAAAGMAPDADAVEVDERVALGQLLHAGDLVGQRVVADVLDVGVVEGLGAIRRAHAVDGDDDEAQFGQRLVVAVRRREAAACAPNRPAGPGRCS